MLKKKKPVEIVAFAVFRCYKHTHVFNLVFAHGFKIMFLCGYKYEQVSKISLGGRISVILNFIISF